MKPIKVAVIGAGHLGKIHARIYAECKKAELIGICDTDADRAKTHALQFGTSPFFDYRQLIGKVDAVSIATPTCTHYKIAKDFLKHKIHVMVEKPITTNTRHAEQLISIARKNRMILQVGHVERFNPAIKTLQRFCKTPQFIECHRLSPFPKRGTDINVILDLMIHDIDIILSLVKSPLKNSQAIGVHVLSAFEDIANARLTFKNGTVCNLTASRVSDEVMRKIRIFQKDSYTSLDYASQKITYYKKSRSGIIKKEIIVEKKEPLLEELYSFLQCIQQGKKPVVCGRDAKEALSIALSLTKKIRRSRNAK
ncbi:MAG: Gfo/Idh/MocA family oxidoreductase [Candidatus Omnitrophica bacterium]|nr:Gfo/Idh/MocA family oxidoreductase [Candidatus Omnitrophota bacterium]MBU4479299.1 Gfo/Idh/MocA family oxidoreductase [Candidatus Omnitrophota bacterium]MCG2704008.1 Gfo/Idh/MocA family oxidoreductase [Candidatus Omnitrophota bacterium]